MPLFLGILLIPAGLSDKESHGGKNGKEMVEGCRGDDGEGRGDGDGWVES